MNYYTTVLFRIALLLAVIPFCCGFSWGLGKSDPCVEARKTLSTLTTVTDLVKQTQLEETILKACPTGAAGLFVKAQQAEKAKKPDAAMTLYREALTKDTTIAEAHGNLGLLLSEQGRKEEASVELTKGLAGRSDPRYHRAVGHIMRNSSLPSLALFHYNEALKAFPDDVEILAGSAYAYVQLGQLDKAEAAFIRLKTLQPAEVKYLVGLAEVYRKAGRLDRCIEELQAYLRNNSADAVGHRLLAEVLMEKGEREAARKEFLLAGVDVSINTDDFARKGDTFMKAREFGQAISAYQTALNGRPAWPDVQFKLSKAQMSAGRDDDALSTLTTLIKSGFKDGAAFYDLGLLRERGGQLDEAISAYRLSIIHETGNVNARRRLAEIFIWRGSFAEAADQYRELIHLRGDNPLYYLNLGRVYDRMKDLKNAVTEYEVAVRLDPNNLEGHRELARIFMRGSQVGKAEQNYKEVLRINSEDEATRNALITLYVKQKRFDDLTQFVKAWLEKAPDDPQRHYRLGIVYEFKKEFDLAVNEYKKAIELQPGNAKMLLALGRTYMKTGRISESREMLEASSKADPTLAEPQLLLSSIKSKSSPQKKTISRKNKLVGKKQAPSKKVSKKK